MEKRFQQKVAAAPNHVATTNACKLCTPLGASLVFHGIEGGMCLLHGSQGCSTYIRRYLISHFKEPLDVASSNFSEASAVYGGWENLRLAIANLETGYQPKLIGVATTCLAETMGEDVPPMLRRIARKWQEEAAPPQAGLLAAQPLDPAAATPLRNNGIPEVEGHPVLVHVSTPSYKGTHAEGFQLALRGIVEALAGSLEAGGSAVEAAGRRINLFPGMASPQDMRHLQILCEDFGLGWTLPGDYSDTLDGGVWEEFHALPPGGTPIDDIRSCHQSILSLELGETLARRGDTASAWLDQEYGVPRLSLGLPLGIEASDKLMEALVSVSGKPLPRRHLKDRQRLVDAYADGHKVVFGQRVLVYGEADLALALARFALEVGMVPVLVATGARQGLDSLGTGLPSVQDLLSEDLPDWIDQEIKVMEGADFVDMELAARDLKPDLVIGHSKGFKLARSLNIPLVRVGFPIHDRFGGARIRLMGYQGTQELFDRLVNAVLEKRQNDNPVGYTYY